MSLSISMRKNLLLFLLFLVSYYNTKAVIFTVNTTSDANVGAGNTGTLRWCIIQANLTAAKDTINFALGVAGPYTLNVASNYAVITQPLYINGFSQANSVQAALGTGNRVMKVILNGPGGNTVYGLQITSSNCVVAGLVIQRFYQGILINGGSNNWIWGCYIGTSVTGLAADATTECTNDGIALINNSHNNTMGTNGDGTNDANEGNLIAANGSSGVQYAGECISFNKPGNISTDCTANTVAGNYLGTNETGTAALYFNATAGKQRGSGIQMNYSTANIIGTNADGVSDALERNVISGNSDEGVVLVGSTGNKIKGNYIGVDKTGNVGLPNYIDGGTALSTGQIAWNESERDPPQPRHRHWLA